jgi:hypothetical protein
MLIIILGCNCFGYSLSDLLALRTTKARIPIVFRFIIEYSCSRDFGPQVIIIIIVLHIFI